LTAINHALTGALIGFSVSNTLLAIVLAFVSHFILDSIPHFGKQDGGDKWLKSKTFKSMLIVDTGLCFLLVVLISANHPLNYILAVVCAFVAASPDLFSINRFYSVINNKKWKPNLYTKFAGGIQWFEKPIGAAVEITWFLIMAISVGLFI
jgi:putative flippase GtrA